jgi:hypothetical protein
MDTAPKSEHPSMRFERRAHPRLPILRPARLVRDGGVISGGLTFARTTDVSLGGALIEIAAPRSFNPGEAVRVAILADSVVIDPRAMADATVVRVENIGPGRQRVAVRYACQQSLPVAA